MPELAVRPCLQPGCGEYAATNGRCEEHAKAKEQQRGTTKERGYAGAWRFKRIQILTRDGYECQIQTHCGKSHGRQDGDHATQVDHIIPISERPDLRLDDDNLRAACESCNAAKGERADYAAYEAAKAARLAGLYTRTKR